MNTKRACELGLSLALAGGPAVLNAQSEPAVDLDAEIRWLRAERVTVRTATLREESLSHAPATIRVITREQIRNRGYRSLYELLRDQPGIDVLDHAQAESKHRFTIRGVTGNHKFIILQDGVRINSPTGENIQPIAENYPLYNVRQVEILLGPASAVYGADAFTAVINLITEDPPPEGRLETAVEVGEFGTRRLDAYGARRFNDRLALSAGGHIQETDAPNLRAAYPDAYPFEDLKNFDGSPAIPMSERNDYTGAFRSFSSWLKLEIGDHLTFGWNQSLFRSRYSESTRPEFTNYEEFGDTLLLTGYGRQTVNLSDRLAGQWTLSYSRYEQLPESRFNNQVSGFTDAYKYGLGESVRLEPRLTYTQDRHIYTAGLLLERIHAIPHTADLAEPYDRDKGPDGQNQFHPGSDGTLPIEIFDIWYNNVGGFAQHQGQWTPEFSTTIGSRFDYSEDYGSTLNPRLGLVFEASERTTWKALYGRAFLAPSPFERYENFGSFAFKRADGLYQSFFFHVPNPDLKPEVLQTVEFGVSHSPADRLTIGLVGFYTTIDDLILNSATPQPVSDFVPGGIITFTEASQNIGESEAYGGELTIDQTFRVGARSRLDAWASATLLDGYLDNQLTGARTDLPFTSKQMARAGVTWNVAERLVATLSVRWNGPQTGFSADPNREIVTDAFTVVDMYAELRNATRRRALFIRVNNLFDARYENAGRDLFFLQDANPQDPRWITAGVRLAF